MRSHQPNNGAHPPTKTRAQQLPGTRKGHGAQQGNQVVLNNNEATTRKLTVGERMLGSKALCVSCSVDSELSIWGSPKLSGRPSTYTTPMSGRVWLFLNTTTGLHPPLKIQSIALGPAKYNRGMVMHRDHHTEAVGWSLASSRGPLRISQ